MKKFSWLLMAAFLAVCALEAHAVNKYDIKSGIITLETALKVSKKEIKMTKIVYFDDYGKKNARRPIPTASLTACSFRTEKIESRYR